LRIQFAAVLFAREIKRPAGNVPAAANAQRLRSAENLFIIVVGCARFSLEQPNDSA
jgi:hypothetical protein